MVSTIAALWALDMIFDKVPKPPTNLEIVLRKIAKAEEVRTAAGVQDAIRFMVGSWNLNCGLEFRYITVNFGERGKKCVVKNSRGDILFLFTKKSDVEDIKDAILLRCI